MGGWGGSVCVRGTEDYEGNSCKGDKVSGDASQRRNHIYITLTHPTSASVCNFIKPTHTIRTSCFQHKRHLKEKKRNAINVFFVPH